MPFDFARTIGDEEQLQRALEDSDIATLAMVLVQLSGKTEILERIAPCIRGPWDYSVDMPDELQAEIRARLVDVLKDYAALGRDLPPPPSAKHLQQMMSVCVGEEVSDEYAPMMLEELALHEDDPRGIQWRNKPPAGKIENFNVIIIGAGMSGLLAAVKLKQEITGNWEITGNYGDSALKLR